MVIRCDSVMTLWGCKNHKEIAKIHKLICQSKSQDLKTFHLIRIDSAWWRHQMKTFSALLALCAGNSPVTGKFPAQRPVTRSFGVSFDLHLNKQLSKLSWGWWHHCTHYDVTVVIPTPYADTRLHLPDFYCPTRTSVRRSHPWTILANTAKES